MSTETNKAICRRYLAQVWNERRMDLLDEFVDENIVQYLGSLGGAVPGAENMAAGMKMGLRAFPDLQLSVQDEIAEGDKVVFRWTMTATHQGEYLGIPATGKQIEQTGVAIYRLADARIVELWFYPDNVGLMQQLGALPTPESA
jgi:steroid delta-isomerase-like uncharacterized protein